VSKIRWSEVVAVLLMLGCSESSDGEPMGSSGNRAQGVAGSASDGVPSEGMAPTRARRGQVTLLGSSAAVATSSWTLSGPAEDAGTDEDIVSCRLTTSGSAATLDISASAAGAGRPSAELSLELLAVGPISGELTYDELAPSAQLSFQASFPGTKSAAYDYAYGYDSAVSPIVHSSCSVVVSELSERNAIGQVACRNLLSTASSSDASSAGAARAKASVTIAFDCPIVTHAGNAPDPGNGGAGGSTGNSAGSAAVAGTGPTAGAGPGPAKSCHGIASSCSLQSASLCSSVKGCSKSGECAGFSYGCYSYFSSFGCSLQQGCYWSSVSKNCQGSSWSCSLMSGSSSCASQEGCSWDETCEGVATSCSLLGEFDCDSQPGCSWY
jgi:hypothetical protein